MLHFILAFAVVYFSGKYFIRVRLFDRFYAAVRDLIGLLLRNSKGPFSFLLLGIVNGLLPCGMVYIALLSALSLGNITDSIVFMSMFGAGTLPAMMITAYAMQGLKGKSRGMLRHVVPYFIVAIGILLVVRGLNLGIPFISPAFHNEASEVIGCPLSP